MEKRVTILILSLFLLGSCSTAFAVTDGVYRLYESPFGWDGTYADRAKAPSGDYDYTYGDESSLTFTLPWPFSFYGRSYSSINVDTNGNIWFAASGFAHSFNLAQTGRGPVISAWNDDLSSHYYGGVFVQHKTEPERVVVEWLTETYSEEGEYAPNNFEVVLYPDGTLRFDYQSFSGTLVSDFGSGISSGEESYWIKLSEDTAVPSFSRRSFKVAEFKVLTVSADAVVSPIVAGSVTLTGAMTGSAVSITAEPAAVLSNVTYPTPSTWSCTANGLSQGPNIFTLVTVDEAGNTGTTKVEVVVDTVAPDVTLTALPEAFSRSTSGSISFGSGDPGASFQCKLDGGSFALCASPYNYSNLADGSHSFTVLAKDPAGNVTQLPPHHEWRIDTVAPVTTATPAGGTHHSPLTVMLATSETASIHYTMDGSEPTEASAKYTAPLTILDNCALKFRAVDAAGNRETVKTAAFTMANRVSLTVGYSGSGRGTVASTPNGVACNTGCTVHFNAGTPVTLTARSSEYSIFKGWGGDCLGTLPCALVMNMNKAVGVRFDRDTARSVRLTAVTTSYHSSLSSAYHAAPASGIIEVFGTELQESPVFDEDKAITIKGGYDSAYSTDNGLTRLRGTMTVRQGTVRARNFAVY